MNRKDLVTDKDWNEDNVCSRHSEWSVESCRCSLLVSYSISSDRPLQRVLRGGGVGGYLPLLRPGTCRLR